MNLFTQTVIPNIPCACHLWELQPFTTSVVRAQLVNCRYIKCGDCNKHYSMGRARNDSCFGQKVPIGWHLQVAAKIWMQQRRRDSPLTTRNWRQSKLRNSHTPTHPRTLQPPDACARKETNSNHSPKAALTPSATKTLRACSVFRISKLWTGLATLTFNYSADNYLTYT